MKYCIYSFDEICQIIEGDKACEGIIILPRFSFNKFTGDGIIETPTQDEAAKYGICSILIDRNGKRHPVVVKGE